MDTKKKIYLSLLIFGCLIILLIALLIYPLFQKIKKSSENFILERKKLISSQLEIENLRKVEAFYKTQQENLEKINEVFIDPKVPIEFINFLEKNAENSQLSIEISSASKEEIKTDPWPSLSFQISTSGSFPNFFKFLEKLENSPYLIKILNLDIKRLTEKELKEEISGNIKATFLIKVFSK